MIRDLKNIICTGNNKNRQIHRAGWIIVDSSTIIENGYIEVENGFIKGVHRGHPGEKCIDHGPGVLMPPLVNAHLHLELSALKNCLPFDRGFKVWVQELLKKRQSLGKEKLIRQAQASARDLVSSGNLCIGDISSLGITRPVFENLIQEGSCLSGVSFHEFLGSDLPEVFIRRHDTISFAAAGHAPHTTSPQLLKALKKASKYHGLPFSIHVAESEDEFEFINQGKGPWAEFLTLRGINWSDWPIGGHDFQTPVKYINDMGLLDPLTLVVHVLFADDRDLNMIARSKAKVCVCPRSNHNLHGKLPDMEKMLKLGIKPALGTDSLASCSSLNIFDEMAFVKKHYPNLGSADIFSMATLNGAKALGLEQFTGTLSRGKRARFLYKSVKAKHKKDLFQRIISNE